MRLAVLLCALLAGGREDDPVAWEWRVRAWALAPDVHREALAKELASSNWRARASALDALARAAEALTPWSPCQAAAVRAALADPHPNVRGRALDACAAAGLAPFPQVVEALAQDPVGSVRLALTRLLQLVSVPARAGVLAGLAVDADERVRSGARLALLGLSDQEGGVRAALLELLEHVLEEGRGALVEFLLGLSDTPLAPETLAAFRALGAREPFARGGLEALAFAQMGGGDAPAFSALVEMEEAWEGRGPQLLERAARSRSAALARELSVERAWPLGGLARARRIDLLLLALEPEAPAFLASSALAAPLLAEILEALALRRDRWRDEEWRPWASAPAPPAVRRACLVALAGAYARSSDPGAGRGLLQLACDPEPEIAQGAFEALCAARVPGVEDGPALSWAFERLTRVEREERASAFTRARSFPALRSAWIELGAEGGRARVAACELLAGFEGDGGVAEVLAHWLSADLTRFAGGDEASALEALIVAELRALGRVNGGTGRGELERALALALGRSSEVGKVAAAALARSQAGQEFLAARLRDGSLASEVDRRTRIEACIALARAGRAEDRSAAVAWLLSDRPSAAWDLRQRMLEALADSEVGAADEALVALVTAAGLEPVERMTVARLCARRGGEGAVGALVDLVRSSHDLESRRVAVAGLAGLGRMPELERLRAELGTALRPGDPEEETLLRADLFLARARLAPGGWACAGWLEAPVASAAVDLAGRFLGEERPAAEFVWRHELELARILAASGWLEPCLERVPALERLDARLLLALAEEARHAGRAPAAAALLARAAIALLGERDHEPRTLAYIHARRLQLAREFGPPEAVLMLEPRVRAARRAGYLPESR
jgi:hypothetical protein